MKRFRDGRIDRGPNGWSRDILTTVAAQHTQHEGHKSPEDLAEDGAHGGRPPWVECGVMVYQSVRFQVSVSEESESPWKAMTCRP